jgi:hypothetical protein
MITGLKTENGDRRWLAYIACWVDEEFRSAKQKGENHMINLGLKEDNIKDVK